jgi:hypothetical protein
VTLAPFTDRPILSALTVLPAISAHDRGAA